MDAIKFAVSNICTAFDAETIGSKVVDHNGFISELEIALINHDETMDRVKGQHYIVLPELAYDTVSSGSGPKSQEPGDYVIRHHREGPKMYLKRECAGEVVHLAVVVYTREAYVNDPDYDPSEEIAEDASHVVVAVLAGDGASPVTPYRFVHNLAGGNKEYECPEYSYRDEDLGRDLSNRRECIDKLQAHVDWLVNKAKEVKDYWDCTSVVAD